MRTLTYRIIIEQDENNTFHAYVPALRGCHTWGKSIDGARKNIRDAINAYLRVLIADKKKIPEDNGVEIIENILIPSNVPTLTRA